jgi:hypothetical protein
MVAVSRFVEFSVTAQTFATGVSDDPADAKGSRGFSRGTGLEAGDDSFTITTNVNDQIEVTINTVGPEIITLTSGTNLDPRFVARDIEFRLHEAQPSDDNFKFAQCNWRNGNNGLVPLGSNLENSFIIYTGKLGSNSSNNKVAVTDPVGRDARADLGFDTVDEQAGVDFDTLHSPNSFIGTVTVSGAYGGQFDDHYTLMISDIEVVMDAAAVGSPTYNVSNIQTGGLYHHTSQTPTTYTIVVDTTNGASMGNGSTTVPQISWTSPIGDSDGPIELLYPDYWYDIGTLGMRMKFQDAVFGDNDQYTVICSGASTAVGTPGTSTYIWDSWLGDSSKAFGISPKITSVTPNQVGTRGVTMGFEATGTHGAGETLEINCRGPQPLTEPVTQLNFGNVTVSTNSPVNAVWFEIISGAVSMATVKFSLQSDGTFQHHLQGDNDTQFYFGTSGGGSPAPGSGATANDQVEWYVDGDGNGAILATDIDNDNPPIYLFATQANLAVVSSADNAETIDNYQGALVSDFIWLAIRLGANETGANSTINYRMFFDFS